jgi:hypothetical protein
MIYHQILKENIISRIITKLASKRQKKINLLSHKEDNLI